MTKLAAVPVRAAEVMASAAVPVLPTPPPLRAFGDAPSLGLRAVDGDWTAAVAAEQLERAHARREATLQVVRRYLASRGCECWPSALIDLAGVDKAAVWLVEVKSIAAANELGQVRAAHAQLHDYRFRPRGAAPFVGRAVSLWAALSRRPREVKWAVGFLQEAGIRVVWLDDKGRLAGPDLARLAPALGDVG